MSGKRGSNGSSLKDFSQEEREKNGMSFYVAAFFLVAQMAGAGFLALPSAIANTGWIGVPILLVLCLCIAFSGTRLGHCYVILEERWPEYRKAVRQPYMEIARRSYGALGRNLILACVLITLIGSTIVYIILIAQFLHSLAPSFSPCFYTTIVTAILIPFTWLGTPKDFWQAPVLAMIATVIACVVIFIQLLLDSGTWYVPDEPFYRNPTFSSFSLGFGIILAAYGGASVFPTIQNDMKDRSEFWKSVSIAFVSLLSLYAPVAITAYALLGYGTPDNILLYRGNNLSLAVKISIGFQIINLLGTYLIAFNPICQTMEEMLNIPPSFGLKRIIFRVSLILFELIVALAIPDFSLILNIVGGSSITVCSFFAPSLMYMKLADDRSNPEWPKRTIPLWERVLLWEIVVVAIVGGVCSTASAIYALATSDFSVSCLADYSQS